MNRRNFLAAALAAPWVVRSGVLMPVRKIAVPQAIIGGCLPRGIELNDAPGAIFGGAEGVWDGFTIIEDMPRGGNRVLVRTVHPAQKIGPDIFVISPFVAAILKG